MKHIRIEYKFTDEPTPNRIEHPLLELLESLQTQGSIGLAAKHLKRSYRHVWGELKYWEMQLDANLVVWGKKGKPAVLTQEAIQYLKAVTQSQAELAAAIFKIKKEVVQNTRLIQKSKCIVMPRVSLNSVK